MQISVVQIVTMIRHSVLRSSSHFSSMPNSLRRFSAAVFEAVDGGGDRWRWRWRWGMGREHHRPLHLD
jgi:hypothetical protein